MEEKKFNQIAYQNNYKREKYDKIEVIVPKGEKEHIFCKTGSEATVIPTQKCWRALPFSM